MRPLYLLVLAMSLVSCARRNPAEEAPQLSSLRIIDRNGFSETITSKDRLEQYNNTNFLSNQPFQQVFRVYDRDYEGDVPSCITSYHPNGQVKQYLEVINSRASGMYREWYSNGNMKAEAYVVGGTADLEPTSQSSWLFDGISRVWDEDGCILAEIQYEKGVLQGESLYYYPNGQIETKTTYKGNLFEGVQFAYRQDGSLFSEKTFCNGLPNGQSITYWCTNQLAANEFFSHGRLMKGAYWKEEGPLICEIIDGTGQRALFSKERLLEIQTFKNGLQDGLIIVYNDRGEEIEQYFAKNNQKHGEEIVFGRDKRPILSVEWYDGLVQGVVKTWYPNGKQESQKEVVKNRKQGLSTAWYKDGNLMLIEEYELDKLVKGQYFKKGENYPISKVIDGEGVATLYDGDGYPKAKITYEKGMPVSETH